MSKYEDEDGLDGPFNRAMDRAIREDELRRKYPGTTLRVARFLERTSAPTRAELVARVKSGEITLDEAQKTVREQKRALEAAKGAGPCGE